MANGETDDRDDRDERSDASALPAAPPPSRPVPPMAYRPSFGPVDDEWRPADEAARPRTREFVRIDGASGLVEYVPGEFVPRGAGRDEVRARRARRWARAMPGMGALLLGLLTAVLLVVGIELALGDNYSMSRAVAYVAIAFSVAGLLVGGAAVILGRGRNWGIPAVILCVIANPVILTKVLGWASGFLAG